jgi:hypothetical protein
MSLELYETYRDQMRTGDMLAWHSDSLIGAGIRWRTVPKGIPSDSPLSVNHTSGVLRLKEYEGLERRVYINEALENGTVLNLLSKRLTEFKGLVWWYPLKRSWDAERQMIGERALQYIGIKYDYKSIAEQIFGSVSVEVKKLFCSEYYYLSLGFSGKSPNPYQLCIKDYFKEAVRIL